MDPYSTLEVPHDATIEEIKKAHRNLAKKFHPDANGGSKLAEEKFKKIQAAYDCLVDPTQRAAIDKERYWRRQQIETAKRAEAEWQARVVAQQQPSVTSEGTNWGAVGLAFLALAGIGAALSRRTVPRKRSRPTNRKRRRTY
ncbi:MAG: J domain-containing protein [Flavobacteriales bacterium]|nr:J domain-containing protein [Flavobacteriales bacterium]